MGCTHSAGARLPPAAAGANAPAGSPSDPPRVTASGPQSSLQRPAPRAAVAVGDGQLSATLTPSAGPIYRETSSSASETAEAPPPSLSRPEALAATALPDALAQALARLQRASASLLENGAYVCSQHLCPSNAMSTSKLLRERNRASVASLRAWLNSGVLPLSLSSMGPEKPRRRATPDAIFGLRDTAGDTAQSLLSFRTYANGPLHIAASACNVPMLELVCERYVAAGLGVDERNPVSVGLSCTAPLPLNFLWAGAWALLPLQRLWRRC